MQNNDFIKSTAFNLVDMLDYFPNSVVIRSVFRKQTGSVTLLSFDAGEVHTGKTSPFEHFIQVIDGHAEVIIDDISSLVATGESIIVPAFSRNIIKANTRFKILLTIIKSGYEEINL